jgi:hypothetical protein
VTRIWIVTCWVLLVVSVLAMGGCMWAWWADAISDRAMLGITLALSWFAVTLGCAGALVTFYVKDEVES